jgi:hypothetical protein
MEKKHQVFVSSTYKDLIEERKEVIHALLELDCIPAGMELFPATDEDAWSLIKEVIDGCDYYILILAGKYGSTNSEGIGYTEMEYDYVISTNKPIISFVHEDISKISGEKIEDSDAGKEKLKLFREKAEKKHCKFWSNASDLGGKVSRSLVQLKKRHPSDGWIPGKYATNQVENEKLLLELNQLRKENQELLQNSHQHSTKQIIDLEDIADMDSFFTVHLNYRAGQMSPLQNTQTTIPWIEIFNLISPYLEQEPSDVNIKQILEKNLLDKAQIQRYRGTMNDQDFKTIAIQLKVYGLITTNLDKFDNHIHWALTNKGETIMIKNRTIKK